jgi:hypothetical protein
MKRAHTTAARLRRASYAIALVMAAVNYSHFANGPLEPTALAVILGVLSSLSPWLWGLHTRRMQHVQLLRADLVDETGATFDPARRRAFPLRSLLARRWSIDHHVRDPREAWEGYRAHRAAQRAAPSGRISAAWSALLGCAAAPAQPEPAPAPEPISLDDPEILEAARARLQMAAARERLSAGAARAALADRDLSRRSDVSRGGLWDVVEATDEPDHVRRPAPVLVAAVPCAAPTPAPPSAPTLPLEDLPSMPAQGAVAGRAQHRVDPESTHSEDAASGARAREADREARLRAAYDRLIQESPGREPTGEALGAAAGCSKAKANRWKAAQKAARVAA